MLNGSNKIQLSVSLKQRVHRTVLLVNFTEHVFHVALFILIQIRVVAGNTRPHDLHYLVYSVCGVIMAPLCTREICTPIY